jgi:putative flippase GtrA
VRDARELRARVKATAARIGRPIRQRGPRYLAVAVVGFAGGQVVLWLTQLALADEQRTLAIAVSVVVCAVPTYYTNRAWVWGRGGRSSVRHEVAPFWALVAVGLVSSSAAVALAEAWWHGTHPGAGPLPAILTNLTSLSTMTLLWVIRFFWMDAAFGARAAEQRSN